MNSEKQKEQARERMRKMRERNKQRNVTPLSVTKRDESVTQDVTPNEEYVTLPDSSKIKLERLLDPSFRESASQIIKSMRPRDLPHIRWGVYGPTLKDIKELIEVTN